MGNSNIAWEVAIKMKGQLPGSCFEALTQCSFPSNRINKRSKSTEIYTKRRIKDLFDAIAVKVNRHEVGRHSFNLTVVVGEKLRRKVHHDLSPIILAELRRCGDHRRRSRDEMEEKRRKK